MKNTHIRNLKQIVPFKERMETYKELLDLYESSLRYGIIQYPSDIESGSVTLLLPCLLWGLSSYRDKCPDGSQWYTSSVSIGFPELDKIRCTTGIIGRIVELKSILNTNNSNVMYTIEKSNTPKPKIMKACDTKIGDLMEVVDCSHEGNILLHFYEGFVSLTNPAYNWTKECPFKVRVLEPGESVTLTVK